MTVEEPFLLDVYDALIGDNPDVKVVVDPDEEAKKKKGMSEIGRFSYLRQNE